MKVKGLKFSIFVVAHIWNDKSWNIALSNYATKSNPNPENVFWKLPIVSILVKHPEAGNYLFDTGFNLWDWENRTPYQQEAFPIQADRDEFIDVQLGKVDMAVDDIDGILMSHLHWDHADGLSFFAGHKAIQNVYVQRIELADALIYSHGGPEYVEYDPLFRKSVLDIPDLRYKFVDEDTEIFPGVHLITLGGHTRGCLGMVLECENDTYIFPGDAIYTAENLGPPAKAPGIVRDTAAFFRTAEKVQRLKEKTNAKMIFPHDAYMLDTWETAPRFYD
jgi:glyoxylase-like metal-dependent hydrolase (beta-lactamase superfamily II)